MSPDKGFGGQAKGRLIYGSPAFQYTSIRTMDTLCTRRLRKELKSYAKDPILEPRISIAPNESNFLEMHYVIEGSKGTPYEGGVYHGKLVFPKEYPLKPPSVIMLTPSGRFQPGRRLCLSMRSVTINCLPTFALFGLIQRSLSTHTHTPYLHIFTVTFTPNHGTPCGPFPRFSRVFTVS